MTTRRLTAVATCAISVLLWTAAPVPAADSPSRPLVVEAGRPLRLLLDNRTRVTRVGQPIVATLAEDVYSVDRITIPAGTKVLGRVIKLDPVPRITRTAAALGGNLTPDRVVSLQFDTVVLESGAKVSIQTIVTPGTAPVDHEVAGAHDDGIVGHLRQQVALEARRAATSVKAPGKTARIGHYLVSRLPVHPQYLEAGSALNAQLIEPISFGVVEPIVPAPEGTRPPPGSILSARLLTPLDSAATLRGAGVKAVLTRPLLSSSQELILPEGTAVTGKVTFVKSASGFRHNGQLRFLFSAIAVPGRPADPLVASLFSADAGPGQHLEIDEEGGAKITNPKSRFIGPVLAGAVMAVPTSQTEASDEGLGPLTTQANVAGNGVKGLAGFGLLGLGLGMVSRPAAIVIGAFGLARTVYVSFLGKGQQVVFPANTVMQIQLSPETTAAP